MRVMEENKIAVQLSGMDVAVLLEKPKVQIQRSERCQGTPDTVRQENLQRLTSVQEKLRKAKSGG